MIRDLYKLIYMIYHYTIKSSSIVLPKHSYISGEQYFGQIFFQSLVHQIKIYYINQYVLFRLYDNFFLSQLGLQ